MGEGWSLLSWDGVDKKFATSCVFGDIGAGHFVYSVTLENPMQCLRV